ncbi:hypothetical protein FIU86_07465 [Roseovarius sp. THAF9]|nr:hypothetical protein [Roseovarius sp. THAF9]QFT92676.1 hypothetical protein FIU86_07465 [Roseovarius sp. THAF9]
MLDYFDMMPGAEERMAGRRALSAWCGWIQTCPAAQVTRPVLIKEAMA